MVGRGLLEMKTHFKDVMRLPRNWCLEENQNYGELSFEINVISIFLDEKNNFQSILKRFTYFVIWLSKLIKMTTIYFLQKVIVVLSPKLYIFH